MSVAGMKVVARVGLILTLLISALGAVGVTPARAATLTVTNATDSGPGSLRQAIADATVGDTITFAGDYTIRLASELLINKNLTITGAGHSITISGQNTVRVFNISAGNVNLDTLTIANGYSSGNGGGITNSGTLTVVNCTLSGNTAWVGGGIYNTGSLSVATSTLSGNSADDGGAVYNNTATSRLTISNSTISGNSAVGTYGVGGGLTNTGQMTITNSTVSDNSTSYQGGGVANMDGDLVIENSTVSGNSAASQGGGIFNSSGVRVSVFNSTVSGNRATNRGGGFDNHGIGKLVNTIIANSPAGGDCRNSVTITADHSLIEASGANACDLTNGVNGNIIGQDPLLGTLGAYGGQTQTYALLQGSPALDAGQSCLAADQRGVSRPQPAGGACDIGAFESANHTVTFDANLGSGTMSPQTASIPTSLTTNAFTRTGYSFSGWNTVSDGSGTAYANGATYSFAADITLYAEWTFVCFPSITVTNNADSGPGSLRQAIADVCPSGTLDFAGDYTIPLASQLLINKNLTITGSGHNILISGGDLYRVFRVTNNADATLDSLTLAHGNYTGGDCGLVGPCGGGLKAETGTTVTLSHSVILSSEVGGPGGGIYNLGTLILQQSSVEGNSADTGGGIYNLGTLILQQSTVKDNSAEAGGGILVAAGAITLENSTLSGNSATGTASSGGGGAIDLYSGTGVISSSTIVSNTAVSPNQAKSGIWLESGTLTLRNSIVADNNASNNFSQTAGTFTSQGYNLANAWNGLTTQPTDLTGDPLLSALGNYGGPTQTFALLPGSPAINAGSGCPTTDQRGLPRVGACDIGAFESQGFTHAKTGGDNQSALVNTAFANPLAVSVTANNPAEPVNGGQISFTPPGSGASATITGNPKTISGGSVSVAATANGTVGGPYNVSASANGANSLNFSLTNLLPTYTVTFDANGGNGSMLPQTAGVPTALNANTYTRTGYIFAGWGTASGGPVVYADGATYNFATDIVLYAEWTLVQADLSITKTDGVTTATPGGSVTYTITASNAGPSTANGATVADTFPASLTVTWTCAGAGGGTCTASGSGNISDTVNLPAGGSVTYTASASISAGATGTLSNTATVTTPASVTDLFSGNNSATDSDTLLPTYTVSYNTNAATGGTAPGNQTKVNGVNLTLANNTGSLVKTGYTLTGWNTASDGSGTHYALGGTYSTDVALALYAEWTFVCFPSITVANNADSGPGSLRQAIADVCTGGTIDFAGNYTIPLTSELAIGKDLTITGAGHSVTVSGQNTVRVFNISPAVVTLDTLTIANGRADHGAGIFSLGYLTIKNSTFSDNRATGASMTYNGSGGAILSLTGSPLAIQNSTFINNQAVNGGGIYSFGPLSIKNSTFSGNSADNGGGIYATNDSTIEYSTLSGNRSATTGGIGGGLLVGGVAQLDLFNSVIANSTGADCYLWGGSLAYAGYNLIEDGSCGAAAALSGDPLLAPLGNYGGSTRTFALLPGSPAIDAPGSTYCAAIATDQRGLARPQGAHCDLGAFESQGFSLAKTGGDNQLALVNTAFVNPLAVSVTANNPVEPVTGGQISFTPPASGASAALVGSPATVSGGVASVTATANGTAGGPYAVTASSNGANSVDFALTNLDAPVLTINDVSAAEGASGATSFTFTVSLSIPAQPGGVSFDIATADDTATAPADYISQTLTGQTIPAGSSSYTLTVTVNGDATSEPDETFFVNVTNVTGTTVTDAQGLGTIGNDDFVPTVTTNPATAITPTGATLNGTVNANGTGTTVSIEYWQGSDPATIVTASPSPVSGSTDTAVSYTLTGLVPNTSYSYHLIGVSAVGTTQGADASFTTGVQAPSVTTSSATAITIDSASLNGTVNAQNDSTVVTFEYGLTTAYGSTVTAIPSPVTGTTDTPMSAALTGLLPNIIYHYRAVGANTAGTINGLDATFTTLPLSVVIVTDIHNSAHAIVTSATLLDSLHASAAVTGNGSTAPTGMVTFTAFDNPSCTGAGTAAGTVPLVGSVADPSQSAMLSLNGLSFRAHYDGDLNYPAADGNCISVSSSPYPTVLTLSANALPQDGSILTASPANLQIQFSLDVLHDSASSANSAQNLANYLLVAPGTNGTFDTQACGPLGTGGLKPDDTQIIINAVSYDPATYLAKLTVNGGAALSNGVYRLFICGTTSIIDATATTYLNNHTADSVVTFTIAVSQPSSASSNSTVKAKKLPATGFAPNIVTFLPNQPAEKTYADSSLLLEIPALKVRQTIVGVPGPDWDVTWLGENIGYLQGTAFPTWKGNSVLTGHVTDANGKPGPFADLGTLAYGNQIIIHAWGQEYTYEVRSVDLSTSPTSTSILGKHETLPWLTLITCRGYDEKTNTYRWRTVVRAVLVSVK